MTELSTLMRVQPDLGCLVVSGPDAKAWLNGVVTNDTSELSEQRAVFALLLNKQGKIQSDLVLLEAAGRVYLRTAAGHAEPLRTALDRMLVMEDAELEDGSAELAFVSLHGPRAVELASAQNGRVALGAFDPTGHGGALLLVRRAELAEVERKLIASGATLDDGSGWLELRLEGGFPEFGIDYGASDNPHEAGLDRRAVSWSKGCYLGQEVVCMQDMRGKLKRRVTSIELDSLDVPAPGSAIYVEGEQAPVGQVTSGARSRRLGRALALGMVKAPYFEPGSGVRVGSAAGKVLAPPVPAVRT